MQKKKLFISLKIEYIHVIEYLKSIMTFYILYIFQSWVKYMVSVFFLSGLIR